MRRTAAAAVAALALLAPACGSDLGPEAQRPARLLRIAVDGLPRSDTAAWRGVRESMRLIGARRVGLDGDPDIVVTADPARALAAAKGDSGASVLLVGASAGDAPPSNLLGITWNDTQLAYLAGAIAAIKGGGAAIAGGDDLALEAFRRGSAQVTPAAAAGRSGCGRTAAAVAYVVRPGCVPSGARWLIARQTVPGRRMLALVAPRPDVAVFNAVRSVQNGTFEGGRTVDWGIFEDVVGVRRAGSALDPAQVDRLQHVEDRMRSGDADVPDA